MVTKEELIEIFKNYMDPELFVDVWTLGLIYDVQIEQNEVKIKLTFTSPMCPYGPQMVDELKEQIKAKGAAKVDVEVVFEPPWQPSEELKEMLGMG
ncbi:TPA: metal-sulfur cluster assembly factor [Candidatus Woesearchaeota archaeon]|nr:metal-sulfur cluster assembly factor [Candidatus Woesearchaeota archaeon]HIG92924.1 metal-sulfur cluster assembly factor [Candidatus Woesearchaeota archaeon]HIH12758.1 metal-sulfur cluster assembly factor [Candidatus Woesearchaeota archaeon]